jgi:hypothetical protein
MTSWYGNSRSMAAFRRDSIVTMMAVEDVLFHAAMQCACQRRGDMAGRRASRLRLTPSPT